MDEKNTDNTGIIGHVEEYFGTKNIMSVDCQSWQVLANPSHSKVVKKVNLSNIIKVMGNKQADCVRFAKIRKLDTDIAFKVVPTMFGPTCLFYIKASDYPKIYRLVRSLSKQHNVKILKPVLEKSLFNDIYDNVVGFLRLGDEARKNNIKLNRGVILTGKPGTGKTTMVRYLTKVIAEELNLYSKVVSATMFKKAVTEDNLTYLFNCAPLIIFDDIDVSYFDRNVNSDLACHMLSSMDGVAQTNGCCVRMFTTNEPISNMDEAFLRPGRIEKIFDIGIPTQEARKTFIDGWTPFIKDGLTKKQVKDIIELSDGMNFAWLEYVKTEVFRSIVNNSKIDIKKIFGGIQKNEKGSFGYKSV